MKLEAAAGAATVRQLDADGALCCLSGRSGQWHVHRATVLLGRSSATKGSVDVDLSLGSSGAPAAKVCRRQAMLSLLPDGTFAVENLGRRPLHVDGEPLARFRSAPLAHLSLLEAGGVQLLFLVNTDAVARALRRSARLAA
uniref:FHA domain-containing protein n=1 Tax=Chlamydomonas euryale TaxID=1486919 RepID=A0A7R9VM46_9CHLO